MILKKCLFQVFIWKPSQQQKKASTVKTDPKYSKSIRGRNPGNVRITWHKALNDIMRNVELKTKQQTIYDEFIGLCDKDNSPSDFPKLPNDTSDYITGI